MHQIIGKSIAAAFLLASGAAVAAEKAGKAHVVKEGPAGAPTVAPSPGFLQYWKSGLAELSSYEATTRRYGEVRKAQAVLVYVYEELNDDTRIKVESPRTPAAKQVPVLKLNHVLKFNTGVYDYSVMTSVFAGLSGPGVSRFLEPRKVSLTSQEWCGHVYHHVLPRREGLVSALHSYFEAEGDSTVVIPYPAADPVRLAGTAIKGGAGAASAAPGRIFYEDEMPILVRELDGPWLNTGESRTLHLVPSLWETRKRHVPLAFREATLTKHGTETLDTRQGSRESVKWVLSWEGHAMAYYVDTAKPRRLLRWDDGRGERGDLIASRRRTYWERNRNADEPLRKELGLTYGVGEGG
jgi:hypothetical protein